MQALANTAVMLAIQATSRAVVLGNTFFGEREKGTFYFLFNF